MQEPENTIQSKENSQCKVLKAGTSCYIEEQQRTSLEPVNEEVEKEKFWELVEEGPDHVGFAIH